MGPSVMRFHETVIKLSDGYIAEALALLQQDALDETAVHDIRVLMKRLRGMLRLYVPAGKRDTVKELNAVLRDVARSFAAQRDSHVLEETLRQMIGRASRGVSRQLKQILQELNQQTADAVPELCPEKMADDLVWVRTVWYKEFAGLDENQLLSALADYYKSNRKQGREALKLRDKEVLHDWRKRVKYLYYQMCALPHSSEEMSMTLEQMRKLGSLLGKVHDLDVLTVYLAGLGYDNNHITRLIRKRRVRLVKKIRRLYRKLFCRTTKEFLRKMASL